MKKILSDIVRQVRYKIWGASIQRALERAEEAGRETEKYLWISQTKDLENDLKNLREKYEREIGQEVERRLSEKNLMVDPFKVVRAEYNPQTGKAIAVYLGKERLNWARLGELKQQAKVMRSLSLYDLFQETVKDQAMQIMFTKSETFDDMRGGKMTLYVLDLLENIVKTLESVDLPTEQGV